MPRQVINFTTLADFNNYINNNNNNQFSPIISFCPPSENMLAIRDILQSEIYPQHLQIVFRPSYEEYNGEIKELLTPLVNPPFRFKQNNDHLHLFFNCYDIDNDDILYFAEILQSENCPHYLKITIHATDYYETIILDETIKAIVTALENKKRLKHFKLVLSNYNYGESIFISDDSMRMLINTLNPEKFDFKLYTYCTRAFQHLVEKGICPPGTQFCEFNEYDATDDGNMGTDDAKTIAAILESGKLPKKIKISFDLKSIKRDGAIAIFNAIASGHCPEDLEINLTSTGISPLTDADLTTLFNAIKNGPNNLMLILDDNHITDNEIKAMVSFFEQNILPTGFKFSVSNNDFSMDELQKLITAFFKKNTSSKLICDTIFYDKKIDPSVKLLLEIYNKRNELIYKYPEYQHIIFKTCDKLGFCAGPLPSQPLTSLKFAAGLTFLTQPIDIETQLTLLPQELQKYLKEMKIVLNGIHDELYIKNIVAGLSFFTPSGDIDTQAKLLPKEFFKEMAIVLNGARQKLCAEKRKRDSSEDDVNISEQVNNTPKQNRL